MNDRFKFKSCIYFVVLIACLGMEDIALSAPQTKSKDLSTHPVYSGYNFGKEEKVIDFATQPLASTSVDLTLTDQIDIYQSYFGGTIKERLT